MRTTVKSYKKEDLNRILTEKVTYIQINSYRKKENPISIVQKAKLVLFSELMNT